MLATLKHKKPGNISNIKQVHNIRNNNYKALRRVELKCNNYWNFWMITIMYQGIEHARMESPLEIYFRLVWIQLSCLTRFLLCS